MLWPYAHVFDAREPETNTVKNIVGPSVRLYYECTVEITRLFFIFYLLRVNLVVWDRFAKTKRNEPITVDK